MHGMSRRGCLWLMTLTLLGAGLVLGKVSYLPMDAGGRPMHPDGKIVAVIVVAIGRTGSTLLSELFSAVPGAFVVVEPFKKFLVINKSDPPRSKNSAGSMPTMASLLDCSFAESVDQLNALRWPFFCMHSRLVPEANSTAFFKRCMGDDPLEAADAEMVRQHCLSSRVRVLKTIRFAQAIAPSRASLTSLAASPGYVVHVVHVLRHPYKVLVSQYNLGWYDVIRLRSCGAHEQNCDASVEPLELDATQTAKVSTHLSSLGSEVCMLLRNTTTAMRELAPTLNGTYLLRYEDLAPPFTGATFAALWDTMGLGDATPRGFDPVATADKVSMSGHATFRVTGWEVREVHTKAVTRAGEAQRIMASLPECIPVYTDFAYAPWPPASSD